MKTPIHSFVVTMIAVMILLPGGVPPAEGRTGFGVERIRDRSGGSRVGLDQAVARIQRETGGRVLSADVVRRNGAVAYRIKVLMPSGHVRVFYVDAAR